MRRILSMFTAILMAVTILPHSIFASTASTVSEMAADLEAKYSIEIVCQTNLVTTRNLEILDQTLENFTPSVIRELSEYYLASNGIPLTVVYRNQDRAAQNSNKIDLGTFSYLSSEVNFILSNNAVTGDQPITIAHEFGHAIHYMYMDQYGRKKMEQEWAVYNNGHAYAASHIQKNPDARTFISGYAATEFEEDVAETIGHAMVRYQSGQGFTQLLSKDGAPTNLGKKLTYVEKMFQSTFKNATAILQNLSRTYSAETNYTYQSMKFSGDYMQYAHYPQPKSLLSGILRNIPVEMEKGIWLQEMGAWYVYTKDADHLIIFPEGFWYMPKHETFKQPI